MVLYFTTPNCRQLIVVILFIQNKMSQYAIREFELKVVYELLPEGNIELNTLNIKGSNTLEEVLRNC